MRCFLLFAVVALWAITVCAGEVPDTVEHSLSKQPRFGNNYARVLLTPENPFALDNGSDLTGLDAELTFDNDLETLLAYSLPNSKSKQERRKGINDVDSSGTYKGVSHMASEIRIQGCYSDVRKSLKHVFTGGSNTNVRCALHCQNRGYPIAATTKGNQCFCSYALPNYRIDGFVCQGSTNGSLIGNKCPLDKDASVSCPGGSCTYLNVSAECSSPCAGVFDEFDGVECVDGYCCGDPTGKYYTVATVGVLNAVRMLSRRIAQNLTSMDGKLITKIFSGAIEMKVLKTFQLGQAWSAASDMNEELLVTSQIKTKYVPGTEDRRWIADFDGDTIEDVIFLGGDSQGLVYSGPDFKQIKEIDIPKEKWRNDLETAVAARKKAKVHTVSNGEGSKCTKNTDCDGFTLGKRSLGCNLGTCRWQLKDWYGTYYNAFE